MKTAALICEALVILTQMYHTYWAIAYSSGLGGKFVLFGKWEVSPKEIQAWTFCGIIDASIIFAVVAEVNWWAYGGIAILFIINCLYVYNTFEDFNNNKNVVHKYTTRRMVVAYFVAFIVPLCLYAFAHIYAKERAKEVEVMPQKTEEVHNG